MERTQSPQSRWKPAVAAPISFAEAMSAVAAQSVAILSSPINQEEKCELSEALGRVLASTVVADRDQPPFSRVTRDGFALRAQDLAGGTPLRVAGQLRAGEPWPATRPALATGEAIEIMTGAPLPPGTDAVLMVEHAREISDENTDLVEGHFHSIVPCSGRTLVAGENVVQRGSEARQGEILLKPGTRLQTEEIALAASCGLRSVSVYPLPRVAILATGDELVEPSNPDSKSDSTKTAIESHQIYDSNSHSLAALVRQAHAIPLRQPAVRDQKDELSAAIRQSLKVAPLLLLTGGVSMGRYDLVEEVLASLGAEFFFTGVKMQPGKPVVFGRVPASDGTPARFFFGLPGNPVSTMVTFRVFVQPLLAAIAGEQPWQPRIALAVLETEIKS